MATAADGGGNGSAYYGNTASSTTSSSGKKSWLDALLEMDDGDDDDDEEDEYVPPEGHHYQYQQQQQQQYFLAAPGTSGGAGGGSVVAVRGHDAQHQQQHQPRYDMQQQQQQHTSLTMENVGDMISQSADAGAFTSGRNTLATHQQHLQHLQPPPPPPPPSASQSQPELQQHQLQQQQQQQQPHIDAAPFDAVARRTRTHVSLADIDMDELDELLLHADPDLIEQTARGSGSGSGRQSNSDMVVGGGFYDNRPPEYAEFLAGVLQPAPFLETSNFGLDAEFFTGTAAAGNIAIGDGLPSGPTWNGAVAPFSPLFGTAARYPFHPGAPPSSSVAGSLFGFDQDSRGGAEDDDEDEDFDFSTQRTREERKRRSQRRLREREEDVRYQKTLKKTRFGASSDHEDRHHEQPNEEIFRPRPAPRHAKLRANFRITFESSVPQFHSLPQVGFSYVMVVQLRQLYLGLAQILLQSLLLARVARSRTNIDSIRMECEERYMKQLMRLMALQNVTSALPNTSIGYNAVLDLVPTTTLIVNRNSNLGLDTLSICSETVFDEHWRSAQRAMKVSKASANATLTARTFTKSEDRLLLWGLRQYGADWASIAIHLLPTRSASELSERHVTLRQVAELPNPSSAFEQEVLDGSSDGE